MKLAIIGGGGFRVPLIHRALSSGRFAELIDRVALFDADPKRARAVHRVIGGMPLTPEAVPPLVDIESSLATALEGADVVFAAIRAGGATGRVRDERVAMEAGVLGQETVGAGGISYALRSIPEMLHVAESMRQSCPEAWLINFTNPVGMVTEALQSVLGRRVIGICDSAAGLVRRAASAAEIPVPSGSLTGVNYVGLNHLGWLRGLTYDGVDRLPALLADADRLASFEEGRVFGPDLPLLLGTVPNEYLFYYYFHREAVLALRSAQETRGELLDRQQQALYTELLDSPDPYTVWETARRARENGYLAEARTQDDGRDEADLAGGGYEAIALAVMEAVLIGAPVELIVNVSNGGTFPQLPADAVVEVPARISGEGAEPLQAAALTMHQLGLMIQVKASEQEAIRAAVEGNRDAALRAFTLHPLVDSAHVASRLLAGYEAAFPALRAGWR